MISRMAIGEEELNAYIDGELDAARRLDVETALAGNAALAEHAALLQADRMRLLKIYGPIIDRPLPENWRVRIESRMRDRNPLSSYRSVAAIAAALVLAIGVAVVWRQTVTPQSKDIVTLAFDARNSVVRPEAIVGTGVPEIASTILGQALHMRRRAPDLSSMGYTLTAVQVYPGAPGDKPVELVYRNAQYQLFTLYLHRPVGPNRTDMFDKGNVRVCVWQYDDLGAVMAGKMSWPQMLRLAGLAYSVFKT